MGRATQGVKLINLKGNDSIAAVAKVKHDEDDVDAMETADDVDQKISLPSKDHSEEEE